MNTTIETEIVENRAIAVRPSMSVGQAMGVDEIIAQVHLVQKVMQAVMKEGEHYGKIAGCGDRKVLLQPGAQKLTMTFRLCPEYEIQEVNMERGHKEYRIICTLKTMGNGSFVGQGVGCCSTMESKYRFRGGARKCPKCGQETIIKGKAEYGGGWLCFQKKGGCGAKWDDGAAEIESQSVAKVENDNPSDHYNTVLKMAKKRAFVDATITATAASDIFTQDIGDDGPPEDEEPTKAAPRPASKPAQAPTKPAPTPTPEPKQAPMATDDQRTKMILQLKAEPGGENHAIVTEYFVKAGCLFPTENLADLPLHYVPSTVSQMRELGVWIGGFTAGEPAIRPNWHPSGLVTPEAKPVAKTGGDEAWRTFIVPIPRKGQKRDEYLKSPDTIGSLYDNCHGNDEESTACRQRLFGFVHHFQPTGWEKRDGTKMPPSDTDHKFRTMLDQFKDWHTRNHPDEKI